ncbi:DNA adenine methylase [Plastoroseomonas hellenica]|uniref:DNA adenine methylase n=1 Tax=Plastoroseomonas hellenica TaxID=2687306 RepID=UPI001BAC1AAF|nr:DNA adenine methylase [Plastoroseomonas hellenica]MBR0645811.1 DNA adenine methylase [Plastoroseomonas hellenica]
MESHLLPASPAAPVAPYLGGKRYLARRIIERLAATPHRIYVEPFVGLGGVFLRRPFKAPSEVINDISRDVSNLFRILQRHYVPLMDMLRWQVTSRSEFERLIGENADSLTDLERAARFLYLQRTAFGGKVSGRHFGVSPATAARFDVTRLGPLLEEVHARLAGVVIERLPYAALLARYDRPEALFYLDPPYWGNEADYGAGVFAREDFERLAGLLAKLKGRFLLSLNDRPEVRRVFRGFVIEAIETTYGIAGAGRAGKAKEVLISGPKR